MRENKFLFLVGLVRENGENGEPDTYNTICQEILSNQTLHNSDIVDNKIHFIHKYI